MLSKDLFKECAKEQMPEMFAGVKPKKLLSPRVPVEKELLRYAPALEAELAECIRGLRQNEQLFNLETEPDLVEQRIYERRALQCRYRYLIGRARALGLRTILRGDLCEE